MNDGDQDDGFLARWSRRKREVLRDEAPPLPAVPAAEVLPAEQAATEEPEMVEPPSLDLVDKDFDVAHWLKQNVPESWKLAALRRAWESDPAIRDFENPARDYALDWNTPGGAPGYGPLTESDDVEAMVRGIFGDPPPQAAESAPAAGDGDSVPHQLSSHDKSVNELVAVQRKPEESIDDPPADSPGAVADPSKNRENASHFRRNGSDAVQHSADPELVSPRRRRRGGGAMPA